MNWDAIGAGAELLGAAGVIASLLYLTTQIRLASNTAQESAYRDLFTHINHQLHEILQPRNRPIVFKGLLDFDALEGEERLVFDFLLTGYINLIESSLLSNDAKILGDDLMQNWSHHLRTRFFNYPGTVTWWREAKPLFDPRAQAWIDREIERIDPSEDYWGIRTEIR